jgi:hypothetical protein
MRIDIMTDIETLGTETNSTIIQIAAIAFDIDSGTHISKFNQITDITKNVNMNVTGLTLKWWLDTDSELLHDLINRGTVSSDELLRNFHDWLLGFRYDEANELVLWGNGILFDNKMIKHQFEELGLIYPIKYYNDRDVRTIVDIAGKKLGVSDKELKGYFDNTDLRKHDAYDDVIRQLNLVTECYNLLTKQ